MRHGSPHLQQPHNSPGFHHHRLPGYPQLPPSMPYTPSLPHAGHTQRSTSLSHTGSPPCISHVDHGTSNGSSQDYLFDNEMEREGAFLTGQAEVISKYNKAEAKHRLSRKNWRQRNTVKRQNEKMLKVTKMLIDAFHKTDERNHSTQKQADDSNKVLQEKILSKVAASLVGIEPSASPPGNELGRHESSCPASIPPMSQARAEGDPPPLIDFTGNQGNVEELSLPSVASPPGGELERCESSFKPPRPPPPPPPRPPRPRPKPPPPPPPAPSGWIQEWSTRHKKHFYTNCETGHSQWNYPTASKNKVDQRVAAEKPSCLKRARDSDEELPSLKKRAVAFCSSVNDKERVAGVPLYQQRGHLMRQAKDKNKTVSIESYLKQKHLVDGLQKHIAALQDKNWALKEAIGCEDLAAHIAAQELAHEKTKRSMAILSRHYGFVVAENKRLKEKCGE